MQNNSSLNIIRYLLKTIDIGYIEGVQFKKVTPSKIALAVKVSSKDRLKPVKSMIEANMYTNDSLMCNCLKHTSNGLHITTLDSMEYIIDVREVSER